METTLLMRCWRVIAATLCLLMAWKLPSQQWGPPPEALRFGPVHYDSNVSPPKVIDLGITQSREPTDVNLKLQFEVRQRPTDFAYLMSTSLGVGRGIKVAIDNYGNIFLSIESLRGASGEFQLVQIAGPGPLGVRQEVVVRIDTIAPRLDITVDGKFVPAIEPRPLKIFELTDLHPTVDKIEIGGSEKHELIGAVYDLELVFGKTRTTFSLNSVRMMLIIVSLIFLTQQLGQFVQRRRSTELL